jgi:dTDP-4-amino-4,6-dideoxygalactose transaminase
VKVPLLDLQPQYTPIRDEILAAIARVCDSQQFIMGPEVEALEAELARAIGVGHAVGVSSGTDALLVALLALDIGPGDEVIVPAFSFFATASAVARAGATPVFVDVDPDTLNLEAAAVAAACTPRARAVIPVHLFGLCADMDPLLALAASRGLAVIEDAAQAIGATCGTRQAGSFGTIGCFSFFPTKNLGAFGEAGLLTTDDAALAARMRRIRNQGSETRYHHVELGGNFRLDALQAAVLRVKLPHLPSWIECRRANAAAYGELLRGTGRLAASLALPVEPQGRRHTFHQYVVRVPDRDRVRRHLTARGVGTEVYYPVPLHRQPCFPAAVSVACPVAEAAAAEVLALPIFPGLTGEQQGHVVSVLAEALG